jgi:hypothetical protein
MLDDLDFIFNTNGVIKSPIAFTPNEWVSFSNTTRNRAYQIGCYIQESNVKNYVVIDDLPVGEYMKITNDDDKFVLTNDMEGLKQDGIKDKIGGFLKSGFGKALGPIMTAIMSIGNIYSLIQEGKSKLAAGESIDFGAFGKDLVKTAAYPIASTVTMLAGNAIPGLGTAISLADAALGAIGKSPIKFVSDKIVFILERSSSIRSITYISKSNSVTFS